MRKILSAQSCDTDEFSVELWQAIRGPGARRPKDFGTQVYFNRYQNCDMPDPDLMWKHGKSKRIRVGGGDSKGDSLIFHHVIHDEYMLR